MIPRLLAMRATWSRSVKERIRLDEAGVTDQVLDSAVRAFLLEVSEWSAVIGGLAVKVGQVMYVGMQRLVDFMDYAADTH